MSEPEGFLTRWSRLKREADVAAPEPEANEQAAPSEPDDPDAATESRDAQPKAAEGDAPEFDLSKLPPLESITASTDIRAFLLPGVPAELTRAALRRAWVADPAIRDFIGLAENAWDFTAPDTVPGFGSSVPPDVARRLIAGMMGGGEAPPPEKEAQAESTTKPDVSTTGDADAEIATAVERAPADEGGTAAEPRTVDVAMHKEEAPDEPPRKPGRGHGSALPR
jgi:uncharacterized protein DUF3306